MKFSDLAEILCHELGADLAARACKVIRQRAAGESVYIPSREAPPDIKPTDTPKAVAQRYGVPRRTAYNWVGRWRR